MGAVFSFLYGLFLESGFSGWSFCVYWQLSVGWPSGCFRPHVFSFRAECWVRNFGEWFMAGVLYDFWVEAGAVLSAASGAVVLRKAEKCLAENRIVLCGEYSSTCRRVLKCSPQSTLAPSTRSSLAFLYPLLSRPQYFSSLSSSPSPVPLMRRKARSPLPFRTPARPGTHKP